MKAENRDLQPRCRETPSAPRKPPCYCPLPLCSPSRTKGPGPSSPQPLVTPFFHQLPIPSGIQASSFSSLERASGLSPSLGSLQPSSHRPRPYCPWGPALGPWVDGWPGVCVIVMETSDHGGVWVAHLCEAKPGGGGGVCTENVCDVCHICVCV